MKYLATVLFLIPTIGLASGYHHKPPPAPPPVVEPPVPTDEGPAPISSSNNNFQHLVLGAVIVAGVVCIYNECWKEKKEFSVKSLSGDDK